MTTVRTYGNLAEAGFAKSLLEAAGVRAELADEHTYGLGYGPVVGELRLQVDEADLERARQVLDKGPDASSQPPKETQDFEPKEKGRRFPAGIFVAVGVAFVVLLFAVSQFRKKQQQPYSYEYDYDNDGRPEYVANYYGQTLSKGTFDRNHDGRADGWEEYDSRGF